MREEEEEAAAAAFRGARPLTKGLRFLQGVDREASEGLGGGEGANMMPH